MRVAPQLAEKRGQEKRGEEKRGQEAKAGEASRSLAVPSKDQSEHCRTPREEVGDKSGRGSAQAGSRVSSDIMTW